MGLRINQNISSMRVQANLAKVSGRLETSLERLSSGLRINRAADDAAGLAISEKLRSQVRGLTRARLNAQDGISLLQVAEGAMNETHSTLQRMRELALQASNDTLTSSDRLELQKEIDELKDDVDRIANNTEFNTKKLLDGSQSAIVTSSAGGTGAAVTGVTEALADYKISVFQKDAGTKQIQGSNIFTVRNATSLAVSTTKLEDVEQFYDANGQFILEDPATLTMLGNSNQTNITVTKDLTLGELASKIENAFTGNLGITGSDMAFQSAGADQGTIQMQSGFAGQAGEITFAADEELLVALGFGVKQAAVDTVISVRSTNAVTGEIVTGTTTNDRLDNVVQGADLIIGTPTSANVTSSITAVNGIYISQAIDFSIFDTLGAAELGAVQGTRITISVGKYTMDQLVADINTALKTDGAVTLGGETIISSAHGAGGGASIIASLGSNNELVFRLTGTKTAQSGTGAVISFKSTNAAANTILGIADGAYTGSGGTAASIVGNSGVSFNLDFSTTKVSIRVRDQHGDSILVQLQTDHTGIVDQDTALTTVVGSINDKIGTAVAIKAVADTANNRIIFQSTETGDATSIQVSMAVAAAATATKLGFVDDFKYEDKGTLGEDPIATVQMNTDNIKKGFAINRDSAVSTAIMKFNIEDENGTSGTVSVATRQLFDTIIFANDIVSVVNNDSTINAFANANFNTITNKLELTSKTLGEDGTLKLTDVSGGAADTNTMTGVFGFANGAVVDNGTGAQSFNLHIVSKRSTLTVGANVGQTIDLGIRSVTTDALGLSGVDITNPASAAKSLRAIDRAIENVSSSRASLGAIENRLGVAIKNLDNAATNLSSAESRIRDLDIAAQIVDFTRDQILTQAGTSILAQANTQPQSVLQLLG